MFYEQLQKLCKERNEKVTPLVLKLGLSKGNVTNWKNGGTPSVTALKKIADYFGVSTDYLLGLNEKN